jgi:hypothetical protein
MKRVITLLLFIIVYSGFINDLRADEDEDLAKQTQNPVSDLISVPFQNNTNFNLGPHNRTQNVLNIQPVIPFNLTKNWNLITRTIAPVIYQPDVTSRSGGEFGLGDINLTLFLSPAKSGKLIWGVGPIVSLPTATDKTLGTDKLAAGPSVVLLTMPGPWVLGVLANNIWSFAGDSNRPDVNQFLLQYFINYNFQRGWYLSSAPINTANWEADNDNRWTIPIGGGGGKVFRVGKQPLNFQTQAFYNVEKPDFGPEWSLRVQLQFLFPKK